MECSIFFALFIQFSCGNHGTTICAVQYYILYCTNQYLIFYVPPYDFFMIRSHDIIGLSSYLRDSLYYNFVKTEITKKFQQLYKLVKISSLSYVDVWVHLYRLYRFSSYEYSHKAGLVRILEHYQIKNLLLS